MPRVSRLAVYLVGMSLGFSALFSAAADSPSAKSGVTAESSRADNARADGAKIDYVLKPQDLIRVRVFQEDDINKQGEVRISQEYTVTLPLIGTVDLKGKTERQAEELIRKLYDADYLVKPQVSVTVLEYAPRSVDVIGALNTPGVVFFPKEEGMTLLGAISRAGSFNRLANKKSVFLKRTFPDGRIETYKIDAEELSKGATKETWPLQPGDVISVPEKIL